MSEWVNYVELIGRVTGEAQDVALPSGETLTRMRIVVPRDKPATKTTIDTIDIVTFKPAVHKRMHACSVGDVVSVTGQLRRRFWRAGPGVGSRLEVEVSALKRV